MNQDRLVEAVKQWLTRHEDWLLILDNADNLEVITDFLPTGEKGHILLTTRDPSVGDGEKQEVPKGGHGPFRPPASTDVLPVPFHPRRRPPTSIIFRCYLPVTVSERVSVRSIPSPLQGAGNSPGSRFNPP